MKYNITLVTLFILLMSNIHAMNCPDGQIEDCAGVCDGLALEDDCGECQLAYCYDYVNHEVNFDFPCDGPTEMLVLPDDPMNPYWNQAMDCSGECFGDAIIDDCGECDGNGTDIDQDGICDDEDSCVGPLGDVNCDGAADVVDVITMVNAIIANEFLNNGDMNDDGILNIVDVVSLVYSIVNQQNRAMDAENATVIETANSLTVKGDGYIGGIQMTLSHDNGFE